MAKATHFRQSPSYSQTQKTASLPLRTWELGSIISQRTPLNAIRACQRCTHILPSRPAVYFSIADAPLALRAFVHAAGHARRCTIPGHTARIAAEHVEKAKKAKADAELRAAVSTTGAGKGSRGGGKGGKGRSEGRVSWKQAAVELIKQHKNKEEALKAQIRELQRASSSLE